MVQNLTELVPKQQYDVKVQAKVKGQILARGNVKAVRKDVTGQVFSKENENKSPNMKKN